MNATSLPLTLTGNDLRFRYMRQAVPLILCPLFCPRPKHHLAAPWSACWIDLPHVRRVTALAGLHLTHAAIPVSGRLDASRPIAPLDRLQRFTRFRRATPTFHRPTQSSPPVRQYSRDVLDVAG